jgi:hypothetical protein
MFYHLKSAGIDQVERAFKAGGTLDAMSTSFYSGGYVYTHVLTTKRGTQYRVSDWVVKAVSGESQKLPFAQSSSAEADNRAKFSGQMTKA